MVERLKHEGTSHSSSDLLKICVKMVASWSAQVFRQAGDTPSGPGAFLLLFFLKTWRMSSSLICSAGVGGGGLQEVWMVFFQTCNRTHSDCLPVVDSPECWGMVSCNWWCLSYLSTLKQNHWKIICSLACQNNSSLPLWSPFPVCIWPVYTRLYPPFCKHLLWPDGAVWVLQWTMVCRCCRLNESW